MHLMLLFMLVTSTYSALIGTGQKPKGPYSCHQCQASGCKNPFNHTCVGAISCFTTLQLIYEEFLFPEKGCIMHPLAQLAFCHHRNLNFTKEVTNCCEGNFCNTDEFPSIPAHWTPKPEVKSKHLDAEETTSTRYAIYAYPVAIFLAVGLIILASIKIKAWFTRDTDLSNCYQKKSSPSSNASSDSLLSSGSGSDLPTLNQRCLAQDVTLIKCIGQGRYGDVWQGVFHGENVAVKIFTSKDEASWSNEVNIYTNIALYHENVLGFKGSVITPRSSTTEMWLLTAFHERGSLYDYLLENPITYKEMMVFARSICSGLLHLHTEIFGSKGKPPIAHRDLKTRNILLTSQGTCVIADFGLAMVKGGEISSTKESINYKVGTKRYMAPEILDESIKTNSFESFKRADIYAFGLILWEICSCCIIDGTTQAYRLPFHDCVPNNPNFEDMKKVVCNELKRPEIPESWLSDKALNAMASLMKECWHKNPEIRSTVCRVKKFLDRIHTEMPELQPTLQSV